MDQITLRAFPRKNYFLLPLNFVFFLLILAISFWNYKTSLVGSIITVSFFTSLYGLISFYAYPVIKSRHLKVEIRENEIVITQSNKQSTVIPLTDVEHISFQAVVPYLKTIPEVDPNVVIKIEDSKRSKYYFTSIKHEKFFLKFKEDFDKYLGDKSSDIYIYLKNYPDEDWDKLDEFLNKIGKKGNKILSPLIKTQDQKKYDEIKNRYFENGSDKDKSANKEPNVVFMG